jgi:RNA ligase
MSQAPMRHPAHLMPYDELVAGLEQARVDKLVYRRDRADGLQLYCYTSRCVYEGAWGDHTQCARGLILNPATQRIVATPFPKFFNLGEHGIGFPDAAFDVYEKVDGSLIIIFYFEDAWHTATKGSFDSRQALWAGQYLKSFDLTALDVTTTYLAEAIYPENQIVVAYQEVGLILLAAYDGAGIDLEYATIEATAGALRWRCARRHHFESAAQLVAHAANLPRSEEGFVVRFENGLRLKLKGAEYRRLHALISGITPLAIYDMMLAGDDLDALRTDIPEELYTDFDEIRGLLTAAFNANLATLEATASQLNALSDKEVGLQLASLAPDVRKFIFACRKKGRAFLDDEKLREGFYKTVRPTGNELVGYEASYSMKRFMEEAS